MSLADALRAALIEGESKAAELLPGDSAELPGVEGAPARAAVLVPIVERERPTVILTLRPETMRRHAGQIAFPGGRIDPGDAGPIDAALREAEEEIGLSRDAVHIVGTVPAYHTITGFEVIPVIGVVRPDVTLVPRPEEVAAVFEVPLDHLLDPANQAERSAEVRGRQRVYIEIQWEGHRIWGATAAMIVNLSRRLAFA